MGLRAKPTNSSGSSSKTTSSTNTNNGNIMSSCNKLKQSKASKSSTSTVAATTKTCITATYRSSSTSAIVAASCVRPQTLNVNNPCVTPMDQTQIYFGEVLNAWRAKARCNVVPAERTQELFHELSFHPSDKQIGEMLQTAKMLARTGSRQSNGLTFGEFCVLAADLKRFRTSTFSSASINDKVNLLSSLKTETKGNNQTHTTSNCNLSPGNTANTELRGSKSLSNVEDCDKKAPRSSSSKSVDASSPVEVFLGGSCNPTTWRADVAIPALQELGISFYNPQVSDWTPDLIELEHRAKEKARVLFFVMDSETRASAGAIEAAHIAGQNCKQLVLVLHPYKLNQSILNEHISQQEYIDLTRNQLILKELVSRRGLAVLDNIPSGLQRTKEILAGIRDPPSNIASILVVIRGAFDRVSPVNDTISVEQCQRALSYLGYAQSLLTLDNLSKIITSQSESLNALQKRSTKKCAHADQSNLSSDHVRISTTKAASTSTATSTKSASISINFELFCVVSAYLSVLQQEIHESGCISPIKGTNVPPPPVYLTNMQSDEGFTINFLTNKNISRTSSSNSVPGSDERQNLNDLLSRSRDSGTSSPQPLEAPIKFKSSILKGIQRNEVVTSSMNTPAINTEPVNMNSTERNTTSSANMTGEESDSNDSVFSSSSSINSVNYCSDPTSFSSLDFRDVYLGGSCFLRTTWRQEIAMPYLKLKGVTFHLPTLHESIQPSKLNLPDKTLDEIRPVSLQERTLVRKCRKYQGTSKSPRNNDGENLLQVNEEEEVTVEEACNSWSLPTMRPNLYNHSLLDSSRVLLFVITNETRSLAPMTLAAHCIGLMYNVVLTVQMLPDDCIISQEKLTPIAIKDYNRGRAYLIDLAKRQGVPVFSELKPALECTVEKIKAFNSRNRFD